MTLIRNSTDAYVSEANPTKSFPKKRRLYLAPDSAPNTRYSFHFFGLPSGLDGCTVHSAVFGFYSGGGDWSGPVQVVARLLSSEFNLSTLKWNKQPGLTGPSASLSKTDAADGTLWELNVQPLLQNIADGQDWFGFRLESQSGSSGRYLYSGDADEALRPYLDIVYSEAPAPPDGLWPDEGKSVSITKPVLRWNFVDDAGDTTQASFDLRFFSSEANAEANVSPTYEVLGHPETLSQADLNALGYSGLAADQNVWWRVRVTDGAGLVSQWSEVAWFKRTTKGALSITNPAAPTNNFVTESTPPISWSFTGRTQEIFNVTVVDLDDPFNRFWKSGPITSTETSVTVGEGLLTEPGHLYRVTVEILDTVDRATTPGDPAAVVVSRDFTYSPQSSVASVTGLSSTNDPVRPWRLISFSRATQPDEFVIFRDGIEIAVVDPTDIFVSGTSFRFVDRTAPLRKQATWEVAAKVNGVVSSANPTTSGTAKALTTYMCTEDGSREVFFLNPSRSRSRADSTAVHRILGDVPPVVISQSLGGYEGSVSGILGDEVGLTSEEQQQNLDWIRKQRGVPMILTWTTKTMRVIVYNVEDDPVSYPDGTVDYVASLDFVEV